MPVIDLKLPEVMSIKAIKSLKNISNKGYDYKKTKEALNKAAKKMLEKNK